MNYKMCDPFFLDLNVIKFWNYSVVGRDAVFIGNFNQYVSEACFLFGLNNDVSTSVTCF
jgi:hypothetical protein